MKFVEWWWRDFGERGEADVGGIKHLLEDLLRGEGRGIDAEGILGASERGVSALCISAITGFDLLLDLFEGGRGIGSELSEASLGAFVRAGVEVEFEGSVGEDDRSGIAAFEDGGALEGEVSLLNEEEGTNGGMDRDGGGTDADLGGADGVFDILMIEEDAALSVDVVELEVDGGEEGGELGFIVPRDVGLLSGEGDSAEHGSRVDVGESDGFGEGAAERAFSGSSGAVDGDDGMGEGRCCGHELPLGWFSMLVRPEGRMRRLILVWF